MPAVDILMYHSISRGEGPICIDPDTFREQMRILDEEGRYAIALRDYAASLRNGAVLRPGFVVITFDDGYDDFPDAYAEIARRKWNCTVFVPAGKIGAKSDWNPGSMGQRSLIDSETIASLARAGAEIGAHGMTHRDLTGLSPDTMIDEIAAPKDRLREISGTAVDSFAPPYGRTNRRIRDEIRARYLCSVGVTLGRAHPRNGIFDLPRLEMWYFRNPARWRDFLRGGLRSSAYLAARRVMRNASQALGG